MIKCQAWIAFIRYIFISDIIRNYGIERVLNYVGIKKQDLEWALQPAVVCRHKIGALV
jgi:hypothetical protein